MVHIRPSFSPRVWAGRTSCTFGTRQGRSCKGRIHLSWNPPS